MTTFKQKQAAKKIVGNRGNVTKTMREVGYAEKTIQNPKNLTESKGWKGLMKKYLSDKSLVEKHKKLLNATKLEHMVFPTKTKVKDIRSLLKSVNCNVRKIQRGEMAIHVWFWALDNFALKSALELAYKLKGRLGPKEEEKDQTVININITSNEADKAKRELKRKRGNEENKKTKNYVYRGNL